MANGLSGGGGSGHEGAEEPGRLSMLLQALARAPSDDLDRAWERRLKPGDVVGRFEILREIGRGGFGVVYEALDRQLGRSVAFKTLRPVRTGYELSADWILKEAEAVARLDHPAIVTLHDVGRCELGPYLVEEMLQGETLAQRLQGGPLLAREAVAIGLELARGLAHAHARGVLHRDLKPGNVFLTESGRVKLLDFGLAHLLGTRGLPEGGTPAYMAPEQLAGEVVDARADVFALAATLFEVMAGKPPFEVKEGRSAALDQGPAPALPGNGSVPLSRLLERCLSRDPSRRPANGQALAEELLAVQRALDRPSQEGRAGPVGVLASWLGELRRRRAFRAAPPRPSGARLALLLAGLGIVAGAPVLGYHFLWGAGARTRHEVAPPASVAVLPFVDMSEKHDQEYFSDGLSEELIDRLSRSPNLRVIARTSSFQFKGRNEDIRSIAAKLGVTHLLEGSVRRAGNEVRITAQLIRASDGVHVWSQAYHRKLAEIFALQDDIAGTVAKALNVALRSGASVGAGSPAPSKEAYNQVLLGNYFVNRLADGDNERALDSYSEATRIDPNYALAWAKLARATRKGTPEGRAKALAAVERSLRIDPNLAYAHYVLGEQLLYFEWDWAGAKAALERAIELDPDYLPARVEHVYLTEGMYGQFDRKIGYLRQIVSNDPLDPYSLWHLGRTLMFAGRFEEAEATMQALWKLNPAWTGAFSARAVALLLAGRPQEALAAVQKDPDEDDRQYVAALAHRSLGHRPESDAALAWFERKEAEKPGTYLEELAHVHAHRGEKDAAFEVLERAYRSKGQLFMALITVEPLLRNLRGDPRYHALLVKMKLDRVSAEVAR